MSSLQMLNPSADMARRAQALQITVNAAQGLQNVIKTNLGPRGTLKMYGEPVVCRAHAWW